MRGSSALGHTAWILLSFLAVAPPIQSENNERISGGGLGFGSYCVTTEECVAGSHLVCIFEHSRCDCHPDMFYNSSIGECYVLAGKDCSMNPNCIENSTCSEGVCKCKEDFMSTTEGICLLRYDALCDGTWPCNFNVGLECLDPADAFTPRQCKCKFPEKDYFSWSKTKQKCVAHVSTGCVSVDNCVENSVCNQDGFCSCKDNYLITKDKKCIESSDPLIDRVELHSASCNETIKEYCKFSEYFKCITKGCDCDFPKLQFWSKKNDCRRLVGEECGLSSEQAGQIFPCTKHAECIGNSWLSNVGICHCSQGFTKTEDNKCANEATINNVPLIYFSLLSLLTLTLSLLSYNE